MLITQEQQTEIYKQYDPNEIMRVLIALNNYMKEKNISDKALFRQMANTLDREIFNDSDHQNLRGFLNGKVKRPKPKRMHAYVTFLKKVDPLRAKVALDEDGESLVFGELVSNINVYKPAIPDENFLKALDSKVFFRMFANANAVKYDGRYWYDGFVILLKFSRVKQSPFFKFSLSEFVLHDPELRIMIVADTTCEFPTYDDGETYTRMVDLIERMASGKGEGYHRKRFIKGEIVPTSRSGLYSGWGGTDEEKSIDIRVDFEKPEGLPRLCPKSHYSDRIPSLHIDLCVHGEKKLIERFYKGTFSSNVHNILDIFKEDGRN